MQSPLSAQQRERLSQDIGFMPDATLSEMNDALRGEKAFKDPHIKLMASLAQPLYPDGLSSHQEALFKREVALAALGSPKIDIPPLQRAVGEELRDLIRHHAEAAGLPTTTNHAGQMVACIAQENAYNLLKEQAQDLPSVPPTLSFKERAAPHFIGISGAFEDFKKREVERLFKRAELDSPAADGAFLAGKQLASMMSEDYDAMNRDRFMAALHGIPAEKINGLTDIERGTAGLIKNVATLYGTVHDKEIKRSAEDSKVQRSNLITLAAAVAPTYTIPPLAPPARLGKPFRHS